MKYLLSVLAACLMAVTAWAATDVKTDVKEVSTPGGLSAWLVEDHSLPFVALELGFQGGTSLDAPTRRGAIYLMTGLLQEGSGDLDAREFARRADELAARFYFDSSDDSVTISVRFLTEHRAQVLALLRDVLMQPRYDQDAVDRVRAQVLSGLRSAAYDPDDIAGRTLNKLLYGDHPYGVTGEGTLETVASLTRDDMLDAHSAVFARDRVHVAAVGDITAEALAGALDDLLGGLPETGEPMPAVTVPDIQGGTTVVDFQTPQSVVLFAQPGIEQDDPDFFAAFVMNTILGGDGFASRLMLEVRENRGLTYGIYTYLVLGDLAVSYLGGFSSSNARVAEAIDVVRTEWERAATEGFTEDEVARAKTYLTGAYPLRFDGNGRIASILVAMQEADLPIDYIATRNDKVNAVTVADVNRVAAELLQPELLQFVVVGQPEGLAAATSN
ncbi:MAG: insulinase family protein [Rhodobacteraceae bacterium]|nr:insulinase family protein [Paracoccaceae bacterium]